MFLLSGEQFGEFIVDLKNKGTMDLCFGMLGNDRKIYQGALHTQSGAVFVHSDAST